MSIAFTKEELAMPVIGPNAVTRMAQALSDRLGDVLCEEIFASAGLAHHLREPPTHMIPAADVTRLHRETLARLGAERAAAIGREAGRLTGDYLLANRIPIVAQRILKLLPRALAARILTSAIAGHAWTFAGGAAFSYAFVPHLQLRIKGSPICRGLWTEAPACAYYAATFERVFSEMLGPTLRVTEIECEATGAASCVFEVIW
jgi:divinyl protochlorophyllide a 8-vinyl-reductase